MEQVFPIDRLLEQARSAGGAWHEFLRVDDLSLGLYLLKAGADDPQTPHAEDEVYYVVRGRGRLRVEERDHDAAPGSILFVPARAGHRFHDIREDLELLVFFAPAEGSRG
jgi:mannose-6-phosphate isomerase-like protein (cupin superfamily)